MGIHEIKQAGVVGAALILAPILLPLSRGRRHPIAHPKILIIPQTTRLGDLVSVTHTFRALKQVYPDAHVAVLISIKSSAILSGNPDVDEIIRYKNKGMFDLVYSLYKRRFDVAVNFSGTAMGSAVALLSRATLRIKLTRRPRPIFEALSDWLNTDTFLYESSTYLPTHYLKMLKPLGVSSVDTGPKIYIEKGSEARANSFMQSKNVTKRPIVAISITAGNKIKEWGDDKFSELAEAIVSNFDVSLMWLGGSRDEKRITHFVKTLSKNAEDRSFVVAGADLRDVPALLRHSALYIAVDTGPIHIAHALGVPLVDIVGPVDPGELVPRGPKCLAIFPEASIEPSVFAFKKNGRLEEQKAALDSITVERVFREIDAFIRTNKLFE